MLKSLQNVKSKALGLHTLANTLGQGLNLQLLYTEQISTYFVHIFLQIFLHIYCLLVIRSHCLLSCYCNFFVLFCSSLYLDGKLFGCFNFGLPEVKTSGPIKKKKKYAKIFIQFLYFKWRCYLAGTTLYSAFIRCPIRGLQHLIKCSCITPGLLQCSYISSDVQPWTFFFTVSASCTLLTEKILF